MSIINAVLVILGLAIGFLVAWVSGAGQSLTLITGLLLLITGGIIGFTLEWWIDESIRKNRELQRQLSERKIETIPANSANLMDAQPRGNSSPDSETLAEILRRLKALAETRTPDPVGAPADIDNGQLRQSEALAEILRQHKDELHQISQHISIKDSQIESLRREFESYQQSHPDDLTQIKGIGPVYQRKLRDIGIGSFKQLANIEPAQIRRMLDIKNWQRVDIESWVEQARDWAHNV
jgi:hypothetical protein